MDVAAPRSAVIVRVALPARLAAIREANDRMAALGVPAHVTVLFPFLPREALRRPVHEALAAIASAAQAFRASFTGVERRDDSVWLLPADEAPFLRLTAAVAERWPEHPPYGGVHARLIPHVTLVEAPDPARLHAAAAAAEEVGPFDVAVTELHLITEARTHAWHRRWRFPLGRSDTGDDPSRALDSRP
jgi:2'-5' RNA ligase